MGFWRESCKSCSLPVSPDPPTRHHCGLIQWPQIRGTLCTIEHAWGILTCSMYAGAQCTERDRTDRYRERQRVSERTESARERQRRERERELPDPQDIELSKW